MCLLIHLCAELHSKKLIDSESLKAGGGEGGGCPLPGQGGHETGELATHEIDYIKFEFSIIFEIILRNVAEFIPSYFPSTTAQIIEPNVSRKIFSFVNKLQNFIKNEIQISRQKFQKTLVLAPPKGKISSRRAQLQSHSGGACTE